MQYRNSGTSEEHVIQNRFTTYLLVALRRRKSAVLSHRDSHQQHEQPIESSDNVFASAYDMEDAVCRALDLQTEYAALMRGARQADISFQSVKRTLICRVGRRISYRL